MNRHEFEALFNETRTPIFRYLLRLCRRRADAEDLLQETYLTVWRKRSQFRHAGSAEGYLRRTAFRLYLNQRRKHIRRIELVRDAAPRAHLDAPSDMAVDNAVAHVDARKYFLRRVNQVLESMPDRLREAFVLLRFEGLKCQEIAEITGVPSKTVESRVRRATILIAGALQRHLKDLPTP